ncbi:PQQ-like beta-propeller repeat protein [Mucilaginibacter corticis]|uniref:PQQ-like beta-propeller repeat protein n=1 Tax=Mucilaginibacter corticis TaxID=2597670 RepID=A0A556M9H2_9SPHI|nr:PQQ-binding-like beta-propeller repeat protein [Mucilaginibacter corticis]TSJ36496.1 PQQ-like beta-propeller repeat protein [Mucilaginibacter corticis]
MKIKVLITIITSIVALSACEKERPKERSLGAVPLPDSAVFVTTIDTKGINIFVLNASNGELNTKYNYPSTPNTTWCYPAAGNGLLYSLEDHQIRAIDPKTGTELWTDAVDNATVPILHEDTFFGFTGSQLYAMDAIKASAKPLWTYAMAGGPADLRYANGILYVCKDKHIVALDAKTGAEKWGLSNGPYALGALNSGIIISGLMTIDATSGNELGTVTPPLIPFKSDEDVSYPTLDYATMELSFVSTRHYGPSHYGRGYLSAVQKSSGAEKWRRTYGEGIGSYDTTNVVNQIWHNQLLITKTVITGAGKYGYTLAENHWMADMNTGALTLNLNDGGKGITEVGFILNNTLYLQKRSTPTLNGLPSPSPGDYTNASFLYAIDLLTGKVKWDASKILEGYDGFVHNCVFAGGKGYGALIQ